MFARDPLGSPWMQLSAESGFATAEPSWRRRCTKDSQSPREHWVMMLPKVVHGRRHLNLRRNATSRGSAYFFGARGFGTRTALGRCLGNESRVAST